MKKYYIFLLSLCFLSTAQAQTKCSEANSDMNYAYSHVKSAYDSNNVSDLKYFAHRSLEAMNRVAPILKDCDCQPTLSIVERGIDLLSKVDPSESWEDGRFYVKRARELAREGIVSLDNCTQISVEEEELLSLEMEQSALKQKQEELKQQQQELQQRMVAQQQKEIEIQKELLITSYDSALSSNLKSYNEALSNCECNSQLDKPNLNISEVMKFENAKIKATYVDKIKSLSAQYILKLENCLTQESYSNVDD
ncbi:MAG: hypothetical protein KJO49_04040 [Bacteroidia bacterium]|nr:hypothetical protein [Bacteroidia bacterium]NNF82259.1 hypothetical protein [Flavobacteriaceae bacterium]NNL79207.1 hypothetical protein [Flavobacteriaceae bacterium]